MKLIQNKGVFLKARYNSSIIAQSKKRSSGPQSYVVLTKMRWFKNAHRMFLLNLLHSVSFRYYYFFQSTWQDWSLFLTTTNLLTFIDWIILSDEIITIKLSRRMLSFSLSIYIRIIDIVYFEFIKTKNRKNDKSHPLSRYHHYITPMTLYFSFKDSVEHNFPYLNGLCCDMESKLSELLT